LRQIDFDLLKNEVTFAMNRIEFIYEPFSDNGFEWAGTSWRPSYYVFTENLWDGVAHRDEEPAHHRDFLYPHHIDAGERCLIRDHFKTDLCVTKRVNLHEGPLDEFPNVQWFNNDECAHTDMNVSSHDRPRSWHLPTACQFAGTVPTTIQLAFMMGYHEQILIGCDLGYAHIADDAEKDPHHFHPHYWTRDHQPLDERDATLIYAHSIARREIEARGGKIVNATIGGHLEVYDRVDFNSLFEKEKDYVMAVT